MLPLGYAAPQALSVFILGPEAVNNILFQLLVELEAQRWLESDKSRSWQRSGARQSILAIATHGRAAVRAARHSAFISEPLSKKSITKISKRRI